MNKKILIQANTSFDLYIMTSILKKLNLNYKIDLLAPHHLVNNLSEDFKKNFTSVFSFNPKIRNLFLLSSIKETIRISAWAKNNSNIYKAVFFGAYRDDITSILAKYFYVNSDLVCIKQGIEYPESKYKKFYTIKIIHDYIYFYLFGFSHFFHSRLITSNESKNDYLFTRPNWSKNPFEHKNIFTIGKKNLFHDGFNFIKPQLSLLLKEKNKEIKNRSGVLIIGERTPMVPSWKKEQDELFAEVMRIVKNEFKDEPIYLRPRKHLTNQEFYKNLNPIILDPNQPFDDQLINLNPRAVISVKSTASKVASHYGFNAMILYPILKFNDNELFHLEYLFGDGSPVKFIKDLTAFKIEIKKSNNIDLSKNDDDNDNKSYKYLSDLLN